MEFFENYAPLFIFGVFFLAVFSLINSNLKDKIAVMEKLFNAEISLLKKAFNAEIAPLKENQARIESKLDQVLSAKK